MSLTLKAIASSLGLTVSDNIPIREASIDTRTIEPGDLFVAFVGEQVDGYDFIPEAVKQGAAAILTTREHPDVSIPQLLYPDLEKALALIATDYRQTMDCKVAALTGSSGKTSVKEMLGCILREVGQTFITPGNKNNHLGVPLSILQLKDTHEYAVFELGANHSGEIAYTVNMVKPDVALINNIGPAHIEGFGSIEGVARAKGEIYEGLGGAGIAIVNNDDVYAHFWDEIIADKRCIRFSIEANALAIKKVAQGTAFTLAHDGESIAISLNVPGTHHIHNALASANTAIALGVDLQAIAKGLSKFNGVSGRLTTKAGKGGAIILDDTYNANLSSVLAGMDVLAGFDGRRILVLGDLSELGKEAESYHKTIGEAALKLGLDGLFTCGSLSQMTALAFGENAQHFESQNTLIEALSPLLDDKTTVLVKGSRLSTMEKVVDGLVKS